MAVTKIAITLDENLLKRLDGLVKSRNYPNRSRAIQEAVQEKLTRMDRTRLAREAARLDPQYEQSVAEEGMAWEKDEWPAY